MKKVLCIILSVLMIFSSAFVFGAGAASNVATNPIANFDSYDELINNQKDKAVYGYTVDFLYNSTLYIDWSNFAVSYEKDGVTLQAGKGDVALAKSDMNSYLKRVVNNLYSGDKLYTEEYATVLVNFIGKLVYPDFAEKTVSFGSNPTPNEEDFFELIAVESGLSNIIQVNWCNDPTVDFKGFLTIFGVDVDSIPNSRFEDGVAMATELIKSAVNTFIGGGPIDFVMNLLWNFSKNYAAALYNATTSLLRLKINVGSYSTEELKSMEGLLNLLFGNITDYKFVKFPSARLIGASDQTEVVLYLMMYFAINYKYGNNVAVVDGLASKLNKINFSSGGYNSGEISEIKSNVSMLIDCALKGNVSAELISMLGSLTQENIDEMPNDILSSLKNYISKILRKIADYFDYLFKLFTGEIKYGEDLIK